MPKYWFKINALGIVLYNIFLLLFRAGIRLAALFSPKARLWLKGRQGIWDRLRTQIDGLEAVRPNGKRIWVHCASLGEFEQGRPVIERLKQHYPDAAVILSFFSPSGYEIRKDYRGADLVTYLPLDGALHAKRWVEVIQPDLVVFVKYEFWFYYLKTLAGRKVPTLLISSIFRKNSVFFQWYGGLHRQMLSFFHHLFVQNRESLELLKRIGAADKTTVAGDSRFDRVAQIASQFTPLPIIESFTSGAKTIVAGSTWPPDEILLEKMYRNAPQLNLIIAPHEIGSGHIAGLQELFPDAMLYSALKDQPDLVLNKRVLIIDNIGMLSKLYHYASITYVGGGFGKGIHNTLEAAVHGKPVLFGPNYQKFQEAKDLIRIGAGISVTSEEDCNKAVDRLFNDEGFYRQACGGAKNYVMEKTGATATIMQYIQENRLLTK